MILSRDAISQLIPEGEPILFLPNVDRVAATIQNLDYRRTYLWSQVILARTFQKISDDAKEESIVSVTAGFVPINETLLSGNTVAFNRSQSFAFGGAVLVKGHQKSRIETITINNFVFPIVFTYGDVELNSAPPSPSSGTSTCWVQCLQPQSKWQHGILTCNHVVHGCSIGTNINLSPTVSYQIPNSGVLVDQDNFCIDAAIIEIAPIEWPNGLSTMSVTNPIVPGMPVKLNTTNGAILGSVLRIFQYPTYYGNLLGQRLIIDCYGIPGDSGSLVSDITVTKACGMYMGRIPDGVGGFEGICQDVQQVKTYFDIDFYY